MATTPKRKAYDVIVVGGRCAGASTAMLLSRAGARVLLVDRSDYGTDTLSTHAIMRAGILQLNRWGILETISSAGTPAVRQTHFHYGNEIVEIDIKSGFGVDALFAPRRTVLDAGLVDAAATAGAEICFGLTLSGLTLGSDGRVEGVQLTGSEGQSLSIACGMVIGADGRHSAVARIVDAKFTRTGDAFGGSIYGYFAGLPDKDTYHWYFEDGCSAGAIPTNKGEHCVFAGVSSARFKQTFGKNAAAGFWQVIANASPDLLRNLELCHLSNPMKGFAGSPSYLRRSHGAGWALVGDAGYFKDPITAHGITDALRDAELLSRAVISGTCAALAAYEEERDELSVPLIETTDAIARYDWDLSQVKDLHLALNKAMKREVEYLAGLAPMQAIAA